MVYVLVNKIEKGYKVLFKTFNIIFGLFLLFIKYGKDSTNYLSSVYFPDISMQ